MDPQHTPQHLPNRQGFLRGADHPRSEREPEATVTFVAYPEKKQEYLVGGGPTPLKNMKVNGDDDIPNIWENKKCSKPPTSITGISQEYH